MKINCPNCSTSFSVPDKALGPRGRRLKCVRCGHLWHQAPLDGAEPEPPPSSAAPDRPAPVHGPLASHLEEDTAPQPEPEPDTEPTAEAPPPRDELDAMDRDDAPTRSDETDFDDIPMASEPDRGSRLPPMEDDGPEPDLDDILARLGEQEQERSRRDGGMPSHGMDDDFDLDDDEDGGTLPGILRADLKASKRRGMRTPGWLSAVVALVVVLAGAAGGAYLARDAIVGLWPSAEKLYTALGIELTRPGLGLTLQNVSPTLELVNGSEVLVVRGFVVNVSEIDRPVPNLRLALTDENGTLVQQMTAPPPADMLTPGETVSFRLTLENRLPEGKLIDVRFSERSPDPVMAPAPSETGMVPDDRDAASAAGADHGGAAHGEPSQGGASHGDAARAPTH